jgi:hypothetical protein
MDYSLLPLVGLRVIDEQERNGRPILTHSPTDPMVCLGPPEKQFACGDCKVVLAVGAWSMVGNVIHRCSCGSLNEVEGAAFSRSCISPKDRRDLLS